MPQLHPPPIILPSQSPPLPGTLRQEPLVLPPLNPPHLREQTLQGKVPRHRSRLPRLSTTQPTAILRHVRPGNFAVPAKRGGYPPGPWVGHHLSLMPCRDSLWPAGHAIGPRRSPCHSCPRPPRQQQDVRRPWAPGAIGPRGGKGCHIPREYALGRPYEAP